MPTAFLSKSEPSEAPLSSAFVERVKRLDKSSLEQYEERAADDAAERYYSDEFAWSAFYWARALHLAELRDAPTVTRATFESNFAASLHHLGSYGEAIDVYEKALEAFRACLATPLLSRWVAGVDKGLVEKRMLFLEHRLRMARRGERPQRGEFLDENCQLRYDGKEHFLKKRDEAQTSNHLARQPGELEPLVSTW